MIFATVGTQLPFPRLLGALDAIAGRRGLQVVAQTCDPQAHYPHLEAFDTMAPADFDRNMRDATLIVGHAGIGTILSAGRLGKPLILYPRRASLGEHRNDHQLATVGALRDRDNLHIALNDSDLDDLIGRAQLEPFRLGAGPTRDRLIAFLRDFIDA